MRLGIAFLGNQREVKLLIPAELHNENGVLFVAFIVRVAHGHDPADCVDALLRLDIVGSDLAHVLIRRALLLEPVNDGAAFAVLGAVADLIGNEFVFVV